MNGTTLTETSRTQDITLTVETSQQLQMVAIISKWN